MDVPLISLLDTQTCNIHSFLFISDEGLPWTVLQSIAGPHNKKAAIIKKIR